MQNLNFNLINHPNHSDSDLLLPLGKRRLCLKRMNELSIIHKQNLPQTKSSTNKIFYKQNLPQTTSSKKFVFPSGKAVVSARIFL